MFRGAVEGENSVQSLTKLVIEFLLFYFSADLIENTQSCFKGTKYSYQYVGRNGC
jgi:hypothetical protein